ncbi:hypothetical protein FRB97_008221 [Tulasnella sp. 331]|nr:hypothetical protein FRB97_008221 [Tulasnella sp. 331]
MGADTLQIVKRTLEGLSIVVSAVPIPEPFKSAVVGIPDAVLKMITVVETAKGNLEDAKALVVYVANVVDETVRPLAPSHDTPATRERVEKLNTLLVQITAELQALTTKRPRWKRIVNYEGDAVKLAEMKQKVVDGITRIQLATVVATGQEVELLSQTQDNIFEAQRLMGREQNIAFQHLRAMMKAQDTLYEGQQTIIRQQQEAVYSTEIARLIGSLGTQDSGSSKKPSCLDGTRVGLLDRINHWVEAWPDGSSRALCLKGSAGIGKSSIGATVAKEQRAFHRLGAEFYFTADQQERNEAAVVVLARQLASWSEGKLRFDIANAVHEDSEIMRRAPQEQYRKLIQEPLETLTGPQNCPTLIVLLDGLDECTKDYASKLLESLGEGLVKLPSAVRVIITSRPELHLLAFYRSEPMKSQLELYPLDTEEVLQQKQDIRKYFEEKLPGMVKEWVKWSLDWPGEERREMLVELSQGLWIYATTVARMLADSAIRNPEKQLEAILSSHREANSEYGRNTHLDSIYSVVLARACLPTSPSSLVTLFREVLGVVLAVQAPVNVHTLASLLCPDKSKLQDYTHSIRTAVLAYLQAVLIVPGVEDDNPSRDALPIRFIHKSFEDYLIDDSRCDPRFLLNIAQLHEQMSVRCLTYPGMKRNLCDLDLSKLNSEVTDLDARIQNHLPAGLSYACMQWPRHVSRLPVENKEVRALLENFVRTQLMDWIEVVSLLGKTEEIGNMAEIVILWLKANPPVIPEQSKPAAPSILELLLGLMQNAVSRLPNYISCSYEALAVHADLYSSVLHANNPRHNLATRLVSFSEASSLRPACEPPAASAAPSESHPPIVTLMEELQRFVHEFMVPISSNPSHIYFSALPFMPAHSPLYLIYGHMADDGPIVRRGRLQRWSKREDHKSSFHGDGDTSRMWNAGAPLRTALVGHGAKVESAAWSHNGKTIISGSRNRPRCLSGASPIAKLLNGQTDRFRNVAWSNDITVTLPVTLDRALCLWDATTGELISREILEGQGDGVCRIVRSPNGRMIVSGFEGETLRLWGTLDGAPIGEALKGHTDKVLDVAWSPDSKILVPGSQDGTLRLWEASTGLPSDEAFKGDAIGVSCVAWSPNGKTIVSGSLNGTLRVWNVSTRAPVNVWEGHSMAVVSVAWSPDCRTIVSGSADETLRLWDASTGEPIRLGQRWPDSHSHAIQRLAFSSDVRKIVSASADGTVRLWDVATGTLAQKPVTQPLNVSVLGFSFDGKYVLLEDEESQTIWDVAGEELELEAGPPVRPATEDSVRLLTIDEDGWLLDSDRKRMFWVPVVLRPIGHWGRVLAKEGILAIEIPTVPIIDISAYKAKGFQWDTPPLSTTVSAPVRLREKLEFLRGLRGPTIGELADGSDSEMGFDEN